LSFPRKPAALPPGRRESFYKYNNIGIDPRFRGDDKVWEKILGKTIDFDILIDKIKILKSSGKKIVHCHGCFDLMHPGHIKHFQSAKKMGDILIVTVTPDKYVDKGPGRPVFDQGLRADSIAALECVDYAAVNKWPTAEETLKALIPDIYVKGQEFKELEDKTGKIQKEYDIIKEIGAEIRFTEEIVFSSTKLINEHF
jgi:rfaE bifunctional protein nucleotidyltransferase chain/domain